MSSNVKYYHSSMQGVPQLGNAFGALTAMLDAVLANGFNGKVADTVTFLDGIATVTISAGHLYLVNQWMTVTGANEVEYNGEVQILTTTSTQFTYAVTGTPAATATGSVFVEVAPLGFEIAFTGTNKRAYRSQNVLSNRPYLRVDDSNDPLYTATYAKKGKVTMCQGMSDINTTIGAEAPYTSTNPNLNKTTTGSGASVVDGWYKWYYARVESNAPDVSAPSSYNRQWSIVGDDRGFYFFTDHNGSYGRAVYVFTDFESYKVGDGFNTWMVATDWAQAASTSPLAVNSGRHKAPDFGCRITETMDFLGSVVMRNHTQLGGYARVGTMSLNTNNGVQVSGHTNGVPWPNATDYSMVLHPVYLRQEDGNIRGKAPGIMWICNSGGFEDGDVVTGVAGYPGRRFIVLSSAYGTSSYLGQAKLAFDITGPWY